MSTTSNLSKSVANASPTLVHFNQEFVQHIHGAHPANLMDLAQNARNFVALQETENNMQDLSREGKIGWGTQIQENRRSHQQPSREPWSHYGPPTLSPVQTAPIRCYPESEDLEAKGQKRSWSDAGNLKAEDKDRKRMKAGYPVVESKDLENEYRKIITVPGVFPQLGPGGEMLGYFLPSSSDTSKLLSKDLQQKMNKIDGEIAMVEQTITNLKAKCNELSKVKMLSEKEEGRESVAEVSESRPQTIARLIYSQNKVGSKF